MAKHTFTDSAYIRSHGKRPPRTVGGWIFQQSTTEVAYDAHLVGEMVVVPGVLNLGQAKKWVRANCPAGIWVVMP